MLGVREYLSGRFHDAFDRLLLLTIHASKCLLQESIWHLLTIHASKDLDMEKCSGRSICFLQESIWHLLTIHASKDLDMEKCSGRSEDTYKKSIDDPSGHGDIVLILVV